MADTTSPQVAEPEDAGEKIEQRSASSEETRALIPVIDAEGSPSQLLSERLGSIGQAGIKGHASSILLQTAVAHIENEKSQLRSERDAAIQQVDDYRDRYYEQKEEASVLRSELGAAKTIVRFRNMMLTVGAIVAGYGLRELGASAIQPWAWPAVVIGCLMLLAGWFLPDSRQSGRR